MIALIFPYVIYGLRVGAVCNLLDWLLGLQTAYISAVLWLASPLVVLAALAVCLVLCPKRERGAIPLAMAFPCTVVVSALWATLWPLPCVTVYFCIEILAQLILWDGAGPHKSGEVYYK